MIEFDDALERILGQSYAENFFSDGRKNRSESDLTTHLSQGDISAKNAQGLRGGAVGALERVSVEDAVGRVLQADIRAQAPLPAQDYSAMDGYALAAGPREQERLRVEGVAQTGHPEERLVAGTAMRIFTGAKIPEGANAVIIQEEVERDGDWVILQKNVAEGENIRRAGEDLEKGELALPKGSRLGAYHLALLSSLECTQVLVAARPKVSIYCTGDELRYPGEVGRGGLAENNSLAIAALARSAGAEVRIGQLVEDELETTLHALEEGLQDSDVVVTVGGASVGDHDLIRPALQSLGAEWVFEKVKMKPGKPVMLAKVPGRSAGSFRYVMGVPGNPTSALLTFSLLGLPLLRRLQGDAEPAAVASRARLVEPLARRAGRRTFYRGRVQGDDVMVFANQSSGASTALAWANALVDIPAEQGDLEEGAWVRVLKFAEM
ncbi:MAG: molybdopterin molybdotransferase MoeA [Polyangiaceae bacterium]|nr:molybdopterin molybdotransferase MoeA [Polyangiaceae bacterium]